MPAARDDRIWIQLLQPPQPGQAAQPAPPLARAVPVPAALPKRAPAPQHQPHQTHQTHQPHQTHQEMQSPQFNAPAEEAALSAQFDAAPSASSSLRQQALKAAGAIDRELRAAQRQGFTAPPDTPSTRLAKGFAAARAAVKPTWFEAARTELISAPNDPKRVYRVTTAAGEYCVYYPDKTSMAANSDPRAGRASFGQPMISSCPIPF